MTGLDETYPQGHGSSAVSFLKMVSANITVIPDRLVNAQWCLNLKFQLLGSPSVGSEFCLRNAPAQKKYLHNPEWAVGVTASFACSAGVLGSVCLTRPYQCPLYLI